MIRCVIVDDEPLARDILETYVDDNQKLELVAKCKNAKEALEVVAKEHIDVIFLDIQMPDVSGINLDL